jgi:hypothetical protein
MQLCVWKTPKGKITSCLYLLGEKFPTTKQYVHEMHYERLQSRYEKSQTTGKEGDDISTAAEAKKHDAPQKEGRKKGTRKMHLSTLLLLIIL